MIKINYAQNGYIISYEPEDYIPAPKVFEYDDSALSEARTMQKLLWQVMEDMGLTYSKHNEYNVIIKVIDKEGNEIE